MAIYEGSHINFDKVIIGKNVYIGKGCTIGYAPEHKDIDPNKPDTWGKVRIGDNVRIMNNVNIDASMYPEGETFIQDGAMVMAQSHVGHDCIIGKEAIISSGTILGGHTKIGDHANTGINSTTHQYTEVGKGSLIGAGCFAKGKLEDFTIYHTGQIATARRPNQHQIDRLQGPKQIEGYNY